LLMMTFCRAPTSHTTIPLSPLLDDEVIRALVNLQPHSILREPKDVKLERKDAWDSQKGGVACGLYVSPRTGEWYQAADPALTPNRHA
jgi:hypothetical protein